MTINKIMQLVKGRDILIATNFKHEFGGLYYIRITAKNLKEFLGKIVKREGEQSLDRVIVDTSYIDIVCIEFEKINL